MTAKELRELLKIRKWKRYKEDWDGFGADKVDPSAVEKAIRFCREINYYRCGSAAPTKYGGVQLEFSIWPNLDLEIEFGWDKKARDWIWAILYRDEFDPDTGKYKDCYEIWESRNWYDIVSKCEELGLCG